jgi:hypothetical protein
MRAAVETAPEFSVCRGRECLGYAVEKETGRWSAFTVDDEPLGIFTSRREAASAIAVVALPNAEQNGR